MKSTVILGAEIVRYGKDKTTGQFIQGCKVAYAVFEDDVCIGVEAVKSTREFCEWADTQLGITQPGKIIGYDAKGRASVIYSA